MTNEEIGVATDAIFLSKELADYVKATASGDSVGEEDAVNHALLMCLCGFARTLVSQAYEESARVCETGIVPIRSGHLELDSPQDRADYIRALKDSLAPASTSA